MLKRVMNNMAISEKDIQSFEVNDPFNSQNTLKGFLSLRADYRYGAIVITHINGEEFYQINFTTPKLHYPFDKNGEFRFPQTKQVEIYEKLDGTNVCAYRYFMGDKKFQTYKLRLSPVIRNSRFGDFLTMWQEILEKYPQISKVCEENNCNVSFEMYGRKK